MDCTYGKIGMNQKQGLHMWEKRYEPKTRTAHVGEKSPKWTPSTTNGWILRFSWGWHCTSFKKNLLLKSIILISGNANDIDTNAGSITDNTDDISDLSTEVGDNTGDISDNANDILDNLEAILNNADAIQNNTDAIAAIPDLGDITVIIVRNRKQRS